MLSNQFHSISFLKYWGKNASSHELLILISNSAAYFIIIHCQTSFLFQQANLENCVPLFKRIKKREEDQKKSVYNCFSLTKLSLFIVIYFKLNKT